MSSIAQISHLPSIREALARTRRIDCRSEPRFALWVSLVWLLFYNTAFWQRVVAAMWHPRLSAVVFIGSLGLLVLLVQAALLMMMPSRLMLKIASSALFVTAATSAWFCDNYGIVMNQDMLRNVLQTDRAEASALLGSSLLLHVIALGVVPALLVWWVRLPQVKPLQRLRQRFFFFVGSLAVCAACVFLASASYAVFLREHKPVRYMMVPAAPVTSLAGLMLRGHRTTNEPIKDMTGHVYRIADQQRPLLLFLVVGETARAANFQLGGYDRPTNRELMGMDSLVYFSHASSCGTATAVSVPCMFSHLPRRQFDVADANSYTNLLDVLQTGGFEVEWRDNNAGCKGVCERVTQINYHETAIAGKCLDNDCPDEIMLADLAQRLQSIDKDTVIVFHQMGSHGPAYAQRYPPEFELFRPACHSNELQHCTKQEVLNAYDNTIAYTSHVLRRQIDLLKQAPANVDTALLYVSDHGESLGEQGLYLHGLPYAFAPREQTEVPMLLWTSPQYAQHTYLRQDCLKNHAGAPVSHDNLYHTVLGLTGLRNDHYEAQLDVLASCRYGIGSAGHE